MVYHTERSRSPAQSPKPNRSPAKRVRFGEEEPRSDMQFSTAAEGYRRKRNERSVLRRRPVGQEVKTGASHAPNVGSIPARVTKFFQQVPLQAKTGVLLCFGSGGKERGQSPLPCFFPSGKQVGVYDGEGPPVPIPNTEVKLVGGENTCLATDREDSTMPTLMVLNSSVGRARGC